MEKISAPELSPQAELQHIFSNYQEQRESVGWYHYSDDIIDLHQRIWTGTGLLGEELLHEIPEATIAIPIDIKNEPLEGTMQTLQAINKAAQNTGPVEIMLWANYQLPDLKHASPESQQRLIEEMYALRSAELQKLIDEIKSRGIENDNMRIRVALDFLGEDTSMNQVRSNYMEAIGYDAVRRGFGANHKIVWLDDDMTYMHRNALAELFTMLDSGLYDFVKANLLFTSEQIDIPLSERSEPAKAAVIYAIARRMCERSLAPETTRGYEDECGFGMTLRSYFRSGGLLQHRQDSNNNESVQLLRNVMRVKNDRTIHDPNELVMHAPKARMGTSSRKIRQAFEGNLGMAVVAALQSDAYITFIKASEVSTANPITPIVFVSEDAVWKTIADVTLVTIFKSGLTSLAPGPFQLDTREQLINAFHTLNNPSAEIMLALERNYKILALLIERCGFVYKSQTDAREANYIKGSGYFVPISFFHKGMPNRRPGSLDVSE